MFPRLIPAVIVASLASMAVAALATGLAAREPQLWRAAVVLMVLGCITPLIYAVNTRILPVFSRRTWQTPRLLATALVCALAGAWITAVGYWQLDDALVTTGQFIALIAGLGFAASIARLFRSAPTAAAPPLPYPAQRQVDRVGITFMQLALGYLLLGLIMGAALSVTTPERGRWELAWAHTMLVGWFMHMASGVCYHVLTRWTPARWRWPMLIRAHLWLAVVGTPLMLAGLMLEQSGIFAIGGVTQAAALIVFAINVLPLMARLPAPSGPAMIAAVGMLLLGVSLGASFAIAPELGATHRITHASINLFGWTGMLITGVGAYLFPRFSGQPLRWPRLVRAQVVVQAAGVLLLGGGWAMRTNGSSGSGIVIGIGSAAVAGATLVLLASFATTMLVRREIVVSDLPLVRSAVRRS